MTEERVIDWLRKRGADVGDAEWHLDFATTDYYDDPDGMPYNLRACRNACVVAAMESGVVIIVPTPVGRRHLGKFEASRNVEPDMPDKPGYGATPWLALVALVEAK